MPWIKRGVWSRKARTMEEHLDQLSHELGSASYQAPSGLPVVVEVLSAKASVMSLRQAFTFALLLGAFMSAVGAAVAADLTSQAAQAVQSPIASVPEPAPQQLATGDGASDAADATQPDNA